MTTPTPPTLHIRIIGPHALVDKLTPALIAVTRASLGAGTTYTRQTRAARRAGYVRFYLTATRGEATSANGNTD